MKAEERHELRENDVTGWLQYGLWNWVREYGSYLLLLAALCFLGYQLWHQHEQKKQAQYEQAFTDLRSAESGDNGGLDTKRLGDLIEKTEFKEVKARAAMDLGQYYERIILFPDVIRNTSRAEALERAAKNYQIAIDAMPDDPAVTPMAKLGLAAVHEDDGKWDKAKEIYTSLSDPKGKYAGTAAADFAATRLKSLQDREKAPRLIAQIPEPKPTPATMPPSLTPGGDVLNGNMQIPGLPRMPSMTPGAGPTMPFLGPTIPGIGPDVPSTGPASAPASAPIMGPVPEKSPASMPAEK